MRRPTAARFAVLIAMLLPAASRAADGLTIPAASGPVASFPIASGPAEESIRAGIPRSWKISLVPLIASQSLDAASSYGLRELNPLLADPNGGFGTKAVGIKLGVTGVFIGVEYLIIRKYPRSAKVLSKINWASGIVTTGFAVHNYSIR